MEEGKESKSEVLERLFNDAVSSLTNLNGEIGVKGDSSISVVLNFNRRHEFAILIFNNFSEYQRVVGLIEEMLQGKAEVKTYEENTIYKWEDFTWRVEHFCGSLHREKEQIKSESRLPMKTWKCKTCGRLFTEV